MMWIISMFSLPSALPLSQTLAKVTVSQPLPAHVYTDQDLLECFIGANSAGS